MKKALLNQHLKNVDDLNVQADKLWRNCARDKPESKHCFTLKLRADI
ncbi:MAG: hypothetical protein ACM3JE_05130 [Betaproteobacteria bacterium]